MKTEESNKLIAEFMGGCPPNELGEYLFLEIKDSSNIPVCALLRSMRFHVSWDWIMPVVEKIRNILQEYPRPSQNHCCHGDMIEVDIQCHLWEINIESTHKEVVEFIKWYNENNKS